MEQFYIQFWHSFTSYNENLWKTKSNKFRLGCCIGFYECFVIMARRSLRSLHKWIQTNKTHERSCRLYVFPASGYFKYVLCDHSLPALLYMLRFCYIFNFRYLLEVYYCSCILKFKIFSNSILIGCNMNYYLVQSFYFSIPIIHLS